MKTINVYSVLRNSDQTEGRGPMVIEAYVNTKEDALRIVNNPIFYNKYGVMGCKPYGEGVYDVKKEKIMIFDSFDEFMKIKLNVSDTDLMLMKEKEIVDEYEKKRKIALSKLTQEEKTILGLNEPS